MQQEIAVRLKTEGNPAKRAVAPKTIFNDDIGSDRGLVFCSLPLKAIKTVKTAFDVTVNDVLLAKRAAADARPRAEAMAAGAGRAFDRIIRIEEQGALPLPRPVVSLHAESLADAPAPPVPIEPGELEIHARVTLYARMR